MKNTFQYKLTIYHTNNRHDTIMEHKYVLVSKKQIACAEKINYRIMQYMIYCFKVQQASPLIWDAKLFIMLIQVLETNKVLLFQALDRFLDACFQRDVVEAQAFKLFLGDFVYRHKGLVICTPANVMVTA
ncbi:unnamed protein product [Musa banksii]